MDYGNRWFDNLRNQVLTAHTHFRSCGVLKWSLEGLWRRVCMRWALYYDLGQGHLISAFDDTPYVSP